MQWRIGESGTTIFILLDTISTFLETYRYQSTIYQDLAERLEKVCYKCRDLILMSGDRYFRSKVELLRRSYMVVNFIKSGYCGLLTSHAASVDITTVFLGAPIWHWVLKTTSQKKEERKKAKKEKKKIVLETNDDEIWRRLERWGSHRELSNGFFVLAKQLYYGLYKLMIFYLIILS